jgi:hypothetical protein
MFYHMLCGTLIYMIPRRVKVITMVTVGMVKNYMSYKYGIPILVYQLTYG